MNKRLHRQIVAYYSCHPAEARDLLKALHSAVKLEEFGSSQSISSQFHNNSIEWISASAAGKLIGKSDDWIKTHRQLFPHTRYEERGKKGKWWFDGSEIQGCYDTFLRLNTTAT